MIAVALLLFDEVVSSSVAGVLDLLNGANRYMVQQDKEPAFRIQLVGEKTQSNLAAFPVPLPHSSFDAAQPPGLIIVPSFNVNNRAVLNNNQAGIDWIRDMRQQGAEVASLCAGCYFLAEAGLLDDMEVTSHWAVAADMQQQYPAIKMKSDLVITDQDGIYTSGGAFSSLKLVLYLVEKFCGRETALWVSKMYAIEIEAGSQAHFAVFSGQHRHDDKEILLAQQYIEKHYQDNISMDEVCTSVFMGKRTFIRRFKAATNNTPYEYLQRVRIESAKKAIERNDKDLVRIIDDAGYTDIKTFRTIFKRLTGLTPMEYRKKYARNQKT